MADGAANLGGAVSHTEVIPNGIDPRSAGISPESVHRSFDGDPFRLLFIGRLAKEKGIGELLEAVATLPEVDLRLDVIGTGSLDSRVREFAARSEGRIVFHGSKPRAQLGSFYLDADLLCVPSLSDPLPGVVLESFASGTPVLGTDAGGIPFMIRDGTDGWIVPRGDVAALASSIAALSRDRGRLAAMGRSARQSVEERFSWRHIGDRLGAAIRTTIERSRRNQPGSKT
jgi:glycosyltransferase involved in cell wall biosynthesis